MGRDWMRDELVVAINLYTRLSFGQLHSRNPLIVAIAARLGRSPGSLSMKLCNLASLDPAVTGRGRAGLTGASRLDRQVWEEFQSDWESMAVESEQRVSALAPALETASTEVGREVEFPEGPTEAQALVRRRLGQRFFRRAVMTSYGNRCCITGMPVAALLAASHIVLWAVDSVNRLNPRNGLCLAKTHDAAFDQHRITLDEDFRLVVSKSLRDQFSAEVVRLNFQRFEGKSIEMPSRFRPEPALLQRHRDLFA